MKTTRAHRFSFLHSLCALVVSLATPESAFAATVHGSTDAAVVWVSAPQALPRPQDASMRNHDRTFDPPFIVVTVGTTVRFPNDDPFYHSIYSDSAAGPFDIGYYGEGPGKTATFAKPGIIDVRCHIHAYMHAWIVVADGPFAQAQKGAYVLNGVPAGKLVLHAWDPQRGDRTTTIDVPNDASNVTADAVR